MKSNIQTNWPADMDHRIADETPPIETVVVNGRAYDVPRDVADEINSLRGTLAASHVNREENLRLRELLKSLGACFIRGDAYTYLKYGGAPLQDILGKSQADAFTKEFVAP